MSEIDRVPIIIMSFDRPHYLGVTLESLVNQADTDLLKHPVFLFQDGVTNDFSGRNCCDVALRNKNVEIFNTLIPHGIAVPAESNIGIALNFDRAERFAFESLNADAAIFLEDDLLLGRYYIKTLKKLLNYAMQDSRIAYVGAYGNHLATREEQLRRRHEITLLGHNWAFGLTKRQWRLQKPFVDQYLDIVGTSDYALRSHHRIAELFRSWGLGTPGTSQDVAKTHATILTGTTRISTFGCFGRYIGRSGVHFNDFQFKEMGFADSEMLNEDVFEFVAPTQSDLDDMRSTLHRSCMYDNPAVPYDESLMPEKRDQGAQSLLRDILNARDLGDFATVRDKSCYGMANYFDLRDSYEHPAFLKEAVRLALLQGELGRAERLGAALQQRLRPTDPCVPLLFGRQKWQSGDIAGTQRYAREALARQPGNTEALGWLGM